MLVVEKTAGPKVSRVLPELGLAPVVRWELGREALIFTSLMREVVLGLRDVLTARLMTWNPTAKDNLVVNRLPGPVMLAKLLRPTVSGGKKIVPKVIHYPGHGLPYTELQLLRKTFSGVRFHAFRDITRALNDAMRGACESLERPHKEAPPLQGRVIVVSTAHHREDLAELGLLPQNQDEALIHLLRPLIRLGADLMYGGRPPKQNMEAAEENLAERNITLTLMRLLNSERSVEQSWPEVGSRKRRRSFGPVLFNPSAWPICRSITEVDEAAWINVCRVKRVMPSDAGLPEWNLDVPDSKANGRAIFHGFRRHQALTMSAMRKMLAEGFPCEIPSRKQDRVKAAAFIFMGGSVGGFKGVMPGVFEEFLAAASSSSRVPIYLLGGLGGATRVIADAMLNRSKPRPSALTQAHYQSSTALNSSEYNALINELEPSEKDAVAGQFRDLWRIIQSAHGESGISDLLDNGLTEAENRTLLATPNTVEAVSLVWQGLSRKFLSL
jgi:SLOG cluster2